MQESARQWRPPVKQKVRQLVADKPDVHIVHRDKDKRISQQEYRLPKRRQAIKLTIGRLKSDNSMDRSYHKSETGDWVHAVLRAACIKWLLRMISNKETFLQALFSRPCRAVTLLPHWGLLLLNLADKEPVRQF